MAHWRDGGIGNMPGSDDRPIEEWTLLEKLNEIASTPVGAPMPRSLGGAGIVNWATPLSKIADEAFDEIVRLREVIRNCNELAEPLRSVAESNIGDGLVLVPVDVLDNLTKPLAEAFLAQKGGAA